MSDLAGLGDNLIARQDLVLLAGDGLSIADAVEYSVGQIKVWHPVDDPVVGLWDTDGRFLAFLQDNVITVQFADSTILAAYNSDGRVTGIFDTDGHALAVFDNGKIVAAFASDGIGVGSFA